MTDRRQNWLLEFGAVAVLLLATLGFFWRIFFGGAWKPAGGGDLVSFLFPIYRYAAASLQSGSLPLWNPHLYGGAPFLADMQTGLFYPLNLLLFLLAPEFPYKAMELMSALHVFLAGFFMYVCLRFMEPRRPLLIPAALLGAMAYMFSDMFIVHFGNLNLIGVAAWLPLIVFFFWRALRSRSLGWAIGAGVAFGLATLEGHLQITLYIGLGLSLIAVVDMLGPRRAWADRLWSLLALAVTAIVAVGLSALVLLPTFEYAGLSPRSGLAYRDAARFSLIPGMLGEMLVPALFSSREPSLYWGVWDRVAVGYLGIFPLILAGLAVLLRRGRRIQTLLVLTIVAFLLALGGESVFHGWAFKLLPGFGQLRAPARLILLFNFGLAALAALGLDCLLRPLNHRKKAIFESAWRGLLWLSGLVVVVGGAWAYLVTYQAQGGDLTLFWRVSAAGSGVIFALLMLGASLVWLSTRRAGRVRRKTLAWLALGLVFVDLATIGAYTDLGHEPPTSGYDHPLAIDFLRHESGLSRIDSSTDVWDVWQPNLALMAGLYDVGGVDNPLVIADVERYQQGLGSRSSPLYDFLGVGYLLGSKDVELDWTKFELAFDGDPTLNVYRNQAALPRALIVHRASVAADQEGAWQAIHQPGFDPAASVVLEGGALIDLPSTGSSLAQIVRYDSNHLEIDVDSGAEGYVVLSDPYYPGWRAWLDGDPVEIQRANYAFRAVAVPAGTHRLTMKFQPLTWQIGLAITLLTVLLLLVLAGIAVVRKRQASR